MNLKGGLLLVLILVPLVPGSGQRSSFSTTCLYPMECSAADHISPSANSVASDMENVDLSPSKWNAADRERLEKLENSSYARQMRAVAGRSGLISNTGSPIAVHAGIEALKKGGTAADAAATVALTHITTALGSYISFGGILELVYYEARSGKVYSLNAGWNSYRGETDPQTIPVADLRALGVSREPTTGAKGRQTMVGGFLAGVEAMHKRFGSLPFAQLFQPAIWYAENGITVTPSMHLIFNADGKDLLRTPEGRGFLNQAGDDWPKSGAKFVQADLAKTLRAVAADGAGYMYTGPWAEGFVAAARREGGKVTMEDMRSYQPTWEEPLSTTFGDSTVFASGRTSEGSHQLLLALNLITELQLDRKPPYWKDPAVFGELSRALQLAETSAYQPPEIAEYWSKNGLKFSPEDRITRPYARAMAAMIEMLAPHGPEQTPHHSAGIVVIDQWGNIAALAHSINSMPWGATGIVVGGVPLSGAAGFQQRQLAAIKPGDPVPSPAAPIIVMSANKPTLALATIGSSLIPETARILLGMLGNGVDSETVMAAPPLLINVEPPAPGENRTWRRQLVPEGAYPPDFIRKLGASGVEVQPKPGLQVRVIRGTAALATIDAATGIRHTLEHPAISDSADAY